MCMSADGCEPIAMDSMHGVTGVVVECVCLWMGGRMGGWMEWGWGWGSDLSKAIRLANKVAEQVGGFCDDHPVRELLCN